MRACSQLTGGTGWFFEVHLGIGKLRLSHFYALKVLVRSPPQTPVTPLGWHWAGTGQLVSY